MQSFDFCPTMVKEHSAIVYYVFNFAEILVVFEDRTKLHGWSYSHIALR